MASGNFNRRGFLNGLISAGAVSSPLLLAAEDTKKPLREPVFRVSKKVDRNTEVENSHPLDPALRIAREGLMEMQKNIVDYTATMIKRERVDGEVSDVQYIFIKVRNRKLDAAGNLKTPFSAYMYFLKPKDFRGREALYVEGQNNGKMIAHEAPHTLLFKTVGSVWLPPDGVIAMKGQRYPITEMGIENLVVQLLTRGARDRKAGPCEVEFKSGAKINGRVCTVIEVRHDDRKPEYDFHKAQIFVDDEANVPIRYAAYDWPTTPGGKLQVIEEYTYIDLKLNVGLENIEFDWQNPEYNFVRKKAN